MANIIPPSDSLIFTVGQKVLFYATPATAAEWTLENNLLSKETNVAVIEEEGITTIDSISYNFCKVKFKDVGNLFLKFTSNGEVDTFSKTIRGLDTHWVAKQTTVWSNDIGRLCQGWTHSLQKINKWSLFKPIRNTQTHLSRDPWSNKTTFQSNGAGMQINLWDGWESSLPLIDFLMHIYIGDNSWEYLYPRGSINEPFRLNDFCGYSKKQNKSEIVGESNVLCRYNDSTLKRENWDTIKIENQIEDSVLSYSDVWLNSLGDITLADYSLIIYVQINNKHFIRVLKKLSEVEPILDYTVPLEELFENDDHIYGVKEPISRYYFLGNNATVTEQWKELTLIDGLAPTYYSPLALPKSQNQLLPIFKNALAFPVSAKNNNYKIHNSILLETGVNVTFKNFYNKNRNLSIRVEQKNNDSAFTFSKNLSALETASFQIDRITSDEEGKIVFENCYQSDLITWESTNNSITFTTLKIENNGVIEIKFKEIFNEIPEKDWKYTTNIITLSEQ